MGTSDGSSGRAGRAPAAASGASVSRLGAIGLMVAGVTLFSILDSCAKLAGHHLPVVEVAWFRYLFHFLAAAVILNPIAAPSAWRVRRPVAQALRAAFLAGSTIFNFLAMRDLQLAQTVSINFLSPLLIAALSVPLLGERIGPRRLAAIVVGFGGILLVTRPGLGHFQPAMLFSLGSMTCGSLYALMTRSLAATESAGSMLLVMASIPAVLMAPALPFIWVTPESPLVWGLLVTAGLTGAAGHFLLILAHRTASASTLAPFGYAQIVPMVTLGWLVFGDVPDLFTILGAAVVIASGLYLLHRERVTGAARRAATAPDEASLSR